MGCFVENARGKQNLEQSCCLPLPLVAAPAVDNGEYVVQYHELVVYYPPLFTSNCEMYDIIERNTLMCLVILLCRDVI